MRIAILGRDFPPAIGGIGDHSDRLATELAARAHHVTVICSPPGEQRAMFDVRPVVRGWDARGLSSITAAVAAAEPDVIVWQYNPSSVGRKGLAPSAGRLARALASHAPLVVLAHELWFPWGREGLKGMLWAVAHRAQMRAIVRAASRVIVTTERRADELSETIRRARAKTSVVPIGSNIEPSEGSSSVRAEMGIPDDAFVVAHFGSVGPGRELGPLLAAVRTLRAQGHDVHVLLVGKTGPFEAPSDLGVAVHATGLTDREQLSVALASADAYLHPDLTGPAAGRRGSLMAAFALGLPVVAYRGPDHARQLVDGSNILLVEPSGDEVARALRTLQDEPDIAKGIGAEAERTYARWFSWTHVADGVLQAIQEATR